MENDWDLSSIVRSCKATTFTNHSTFSETPPENLTTTITTTTTNSIISPINTTQPCFEDFIVNQENSSVANTHTMENDWDLSAIVRSCKATTFTNPYTFCETQPQNLTTMTTNSLVSPISTTPSCFADFSFNQENSSVSFTSHKQNDFADLNNLRVNFNSTTHIPTPTTTSIPITVTTTTSSLTTTTFSNHITPNIITNINTGVHASNKNSTFLDFSTPIKQHQMQPNEFTRKYGIIKFKPTTSIPTPEITLPTSATTPTTTNYTTIIPITATNTFTNPTITIGPQTTTPTHPRKQKPHSRIRKNKNLVTSVCHMKEEKLSEDLWQWRKYGRKPIKGSPHSRSYYKCSNFNNCPARKHVEKSKTEENTYVVTYRGKHNHGNPKVKQNSVNGTSRNKSPEARLPVVGQAGSSQNFEKLASPNVAMVQFDQSKSNNAQVFDGHSNITNPETELVESQSHVVGEVGLSHNVQKIDSHNKMTLQRDELKRSNAQIFPGELEISYSETNLIGSSNDDDDILIPDMSAMSEDFLLDFNRLNGGSVLP